MLLNIMLNVDIVILVNNPFLQFFLLTERRNSKWTMESQENIKKSKEIVF